MKKSLIALAALASIGSAYAQSSVEIYGRLDLGMASTKDQLSAGGVKLGETKATSTFGDQSGRTTSRIGFRGTEDLGGGLKATFNYETALAPDDTGRTGSADTRSAFGTTRLANLGVTGGFGTVTIGTFLNTFDAIRGGSAATFSAAGGDFLATHVGNQKINSTLGITALDTLNETLTVGLNARSTNAISYASPTMGGFTFGLGVSSDTSKTNLDSDYATALVADGGLAQTDAEGKAKTTGVILSGSYVAGPLKVIAAYGTGKISSNLTKAGTTSDIFKTVNTTENEIKDTALLVSYDLGVAQPYVQYERVKHTFQLTNGAVNGDQIKTSAFEVGSKFPMGALTPFVTLGKGTIKDVSADGTSKGDTSSFQVGATYDLSKRTYLHASVGQLKLKDKEDDVQFKRTGYKVGLVHSF